MGTIACSGTQSTTSNSGQQHDLERLEALYWAKIDSSRMNFTQADIDFMNNMIGHHAQALVMANMAPRNTDSRSIQTLAARVINAQRDEIETMQKWLRDRGLHAPVVQIDGLILRLDGAPHSHTGAEGTLPLMPGMITLPQLQELSRLRNREFDRTFLTFMIEHHLGAVVMARELFDTDGAAGDEEAFRLASDIHVDQITEVNRMRLMLQELE